MIATLNVLIVGGAADAELILATLKHNTDSLHCKRLEDEHLTVAELQSQLWDLVFYCYEQGSTLLHFVRAAKKFKIPIIILFDCLSNEDAINLVAFGAQDCVPRHNLHQLAVSIKRALNLVEARHSEARITSQWWEERCLLEQLMSNTPDVIAFKDRDLRYVRVNQALCQIAGCEARELIGRTKDEFAKFDAVLGFDEANVIATGKADIDRIEKMALPDGSVQWTSATRAPTRDERGEITGLVVIARDITARVRADEEREVASTRLRRVLDLAGDAIVTLDDKLHIILFNKQAELTFGYSADEAIGQHLNTLLPPHIVERHNQHVEEFRNSHDNSRKMDRSGAILGRRKNGTDFYAEVSVSKVLHNNACNYITIIRDISNRVAMEKKLIQSQKMEAVGQLTGGIAHDFNNLLLVIIGNLDLLKEMLPSDSPEMELIEPCLTAALNGSELSNGLLAFSRQRSAKIETADLQAIVADQTKLLQRAVGRGITIEVVPVDEDCSIDVDIALLRCALTNLVVNARDAMPSGGTITVRTYVTTRTEDCTSATKVQPDECAAMEISDTGCGISPDHLSEIFNPFFTTKDVDKGTGLGLSMVYGFVEQMNGKIEVVSEVGKGTTFKLLFPRANKPLLSSDDKVKPANYSKQANKETILVVDDDAMVRKSVVAQLALLGYVTIEADSATDALKTIASNKPFDLILSDIVMPGNIDGVELARLARAQGHRVLLTSGFTDLKVSHSGDASFDQSCILKKPYRRAELQQAVRAALDGS